MSTQDEEKQVEDYELLAKKVAHYYARMLDSKYDFDDLLQAARLGILQALRTYDATLGSSFRTHAYNHAIYSIQELLQKDTGVIHIPYKIGRNDSIEKPVRAELPEHWEDFMISNNDETITASEGRVVLDELLGSLTKRQREVVTLVYCQQYTYDEVAEELSISKPTAFATSQRALEKLRAVAEKRGLQLTDLLMN
jgi:RNA polymerase sigma factor (sigma-70 family)